MQGTCTLPILPTDGLEEERCRIAVQDAVPVFAVDRMVPDLLIQGQGHEPTEQEIAVQLFNQQPLAAAGA